MDGILNRLTAGVTATLLAIAMFGALAQPAAAIRDRDCSDFKNQRQAQKFFKKHKGSKKNDPHRLDADHDGKACEASF